MTAVVTLIFYLAVVYILAGVFFCLWFQLSGALKKFDTGAENTSSFFKIIITPGLIGLWPLVLRQHFRKVHGSPDGPVTQTAIRKAHGRYHAVLAVAAPIAAAAALSFRPGQVFEDSPGERFIPNPDPLPTIVETTDDLFHCMETVANFRADDEGRRQLELIITDQLDVPNSALYWSPEDSGPDEGVPDSAVFLGMLWGPGTRRYMMPEESGPGEGVFLVYSLAYGLPVTSALCTH